MILFTVFLFSFTDRLFLFVFLLDKVIEHLFLAIGGPCYLSSCKVHPGVEHLFVSFVVFFDTF